MSDVIGMWSDVMGQMSDITGQWSDMLPASNGGVDEDHNLQQAESHDQVVSLTDTDLDEQKPTSPEEKKKRMLGVWRTGVGKQTLSCV